MPYDKSFNNSIFQMTSMNSTEIVSADNDPLQKRVFYLKESVPEDMEFWFRNQCFQRGTKSSSEGICKCNPGYHGTNCSIPSSVYYSMNESISNLTIREKPRRLINVFLFNHEFDMTEARFHTFNESVDLFILIEAKYTLYGDPKPSHFRDKLRKGFCREFEDKILYILAKTTHQAAKRRGFVNEGIYRDLAATIGFSRINNMKEDDLLMLTDADELPHPDILNFLKLHDGYNEHVTFKYQRFIYGFFYLHFQRHHDKCSLVTIRFFNRVFKNFIPMIRNTVKSKINIKEYHEKEIFVPKTFRSWTLGTARFPAGWHCSYCFTYVIFGILRPISRNQAQA